MFWTGGPGVPPPPPVPPPLTPSSSTPKPKAKPTPSSHERNIELEKLRQRGLAKLLNKHFTAVTQTIAQERAAADAALKELEEKSKNMKEYKTTYGEMTPYEEIYIELQKKRSECKRKEKETLMLYQRYVNKFGTKDYITVPNPKITQPTNAQNSPYHHHNKADVVSSIAGEKYLPSHIISSALANGADGSMIPKEKTNKMASDIESKLDKHQETLGAERVPSIGSMGLDATHQSKQATADLNGRIFNQRELESRGIDAKYSPVVERGGSGGGKPPLSSPPFGTALPPLTECSPSSDETSLQRQQQQLSAASASAPSTPIRTIRKNSSSSIPDSPSVSESAAEFVNKEGIKEIVAGGVVGGDDDDDDDDLLSMVSGLTPETCAFVQNDVERKLLDFLKTETDAIKQMLSNNDSGENESTSDVHSKTTMTTMSSGGGLNTNSSDNEIMSETQRAAQRAEEMAKEMERMLEDAKNDAASVMSTDVSSSNTTEKTSAPVTIKTTNPNESWVRYYDDTHKRYYYHEKNANITQWEKPSNIIVDNNNKDDVVVDVDRSGTQKQTNQNQKNDETYVPLKDYTKKQKKSSRSSSRSLHFDEESSSSVGSRPSIYSKTSSSSINTSGTNMSSRRLLYRQKQRRKRRRRRIVLAVLSVSIIGGCVYYLKQDDNASKVERSINDMMLSYVHPMLPESYKWNENKTTFVDYVDESLHNAMAQNVNPHLPTSMQYESTRVKTRNEETKRERQIREQKLQEEAEERRRRIAAEEEQERQEKLKKEEEELTRKQQQLDAEEKERQRKEDERMAAEREEKARLARLEAEEAERLAKERLATAQQQQRLKRPPYCNIPLFYLFNRRCWRLANDNPIYNVRDVVNAMMQ